MFMYDVRMKACSIFVCVCFLCECKDWDICVFMSDVILRLGIYVCLYLICELKAWDICVLMSVL